MERVGTCLDSWLAYILEGDEEEEEGLYQGKKGGMNIVKASKHAICR